MSKIILFGNQKGGVGKTTISVLLANALSQSPFNKKVVFIDADEQQSAYKKRQKEELPNPPYPIYSKVSFQSYYNCIAENANKADYIIIDIGGKLFHGIDVNALIYDYVQYVDELFIPIKPGAFDSEATVDFLKFALTMKGKRKKGMRPLNINVFSNMYQKNFKIAKQVDEELQYLSKKKLANVMQTKIKSLAAFGRINTYQSFFQINTASSAKENFEMWANEVVSIIQ